MTMYKRLLVLLMMVGLAGPAWAVPTGWFSWTESTAPSSLALTGGVTWEDSPAGSDDINRGDDRIRQLKLNIRLRGDAEHCWTVTATAGCLPDSGRSRLGSARAFYQTTAPTVLEAMDAKGSTVLDTGRLWIDTDGADNNAGTTADNDTLLRYSGAAWRNVMAMGTAATLTNTFKLWNGAGWSNASAAETTVSTGVNDDGTNTAVSASLVDLTLVPANPYAVIPATGTYMIHVSGEVSIASSTGSTYVGLKEYDGTTTLVVRACFLGGSGAVDGVTQCTFNYYKDAPTLGATYAYAIEIRGSGSGFYNAQPGALSAFGSTPLTGFGTVTPAPRANLQVVRSSKTLPTGF